MKRTGGMCRGGNWDMKFETGNLKLEIWGKHCSKNYGKVTTVVPQSVTDLVNFSSVDPPISLTSTL